MKMTNELISQKLDCIWANLQVLLNEMNLTVIDDWPGDEPDEDSKTTELPPVEDDS